MLVFGFAIRELIARSWTSVARRSGRGPWLRRRFRYDTVAYL